MYEQAYGKKIIKSVPLETLSGPVIYTNLLGFLPMMMLASVGDEYRKFWDFWWASDNQHLPPISIFLLILGCLVGTGIGYSGWWCRGKVSATSFTLIGGECFLVRKCFSNRLFVFGSKYLVSFFRHKSWTNVWQSCWMSSFGINMQNQGVSRLCLSASPEESFISKRLWEVKKRQLRGNSQQVMSRLRNHRSKQSSLSLEKHSTRIQHVFVGSK